MEQILTNLRDIENRIQQACITANRSPDDVKLLLATKTVTAENIKIAFEAGQRLIGENKVQEIKEKYEALSTVSHEKHFIGHLQTNKIKDILKYGVTCVQSLDRMELAEKLHQRLQQENKTLDVFIQVNTSGEASKFGVPPESAIALIQQVAALKSLRIKGLMTIGLFSAEEAAVQKCFRLLKSIQQEAIALQLTDVNLNDLSMGMSGDLEIAIAEGATIVRVGTAIFGRRIYPDSYYWNETTTQP